MTMHHQFIFSALALLCFLIGSPPHAAAQDPRFSQFNAAPLHLNPAMIGVYNGKLRFAAAYRDQYNALLDDSAFRTITSSFDMRFRLDNQDYIGVGLNILRDQAGEANFRRSIGNLGLSFLKQLGGSRYRTTDQYLIAGAQIGLEQRSFDWERLWFSAQFDPGSAQIDFDAPNGENFANFNQRTFLDFNAGLLWYALFNENASIYAGGALYHIASPPVSFIEEDDERLQRRWVAHAGGELPITEELSLLPGFVFMHQGPSTSTTAGGNFRFTNHDWNELALRAGAWIHVANRLEQGLALDAVIVTAVLELEHWNLGFSYDITASSLTQANDARGGFEISLIYVAPEKARIQLDCPKL